MGTVAVKEEALAKHRNLPLHHEKYDDNHSDRSMIDRGAKEQVDQRVNGRFFCDFARLGLTEAL